MYLSTSKVLTLLSVLIILFACKKEEAPSPPPSRSRFEFPLPKSTFKFYATESDWLNETNVLYEGYSEKGVFNFTESYPRGIYYYDLYDSAYIHYNNVKTFDYMDASYSYAPGLIVITDVNQYRYSFLKDQKESNWSMSEYGGTGVESPACQPLRTLHIDKGNGVVIKDNEMCNYQAHNYKMSFYPISDDVNERYLLKYEFGFWTESNFKVLVLEKVNSVVTKFKIYDFNHTSNYEIYTRL